MKYYLLNLISLLTFTICYSQNKLQLPLKSGHFTKQTKIGKQVHTNNILFVSPNKDFNVRAAEKSVVQSVISIGNTFGISTRGGYQITYGNLQKVFVKKGDEIKRGQIIGVLNGANNIDNDNYLELHKEIWQNAINDIKNFNR